MQRPDTPLCMFPLENGPRLCLSRLSIQMWLIANEMISVFGGSPLNQENIEVFKIKKGSIGNLLFQTRFADCYKFYSSYCGLRGQLFTSSSHSIGKKVTYRLTWGFQVFVHHYISPLGGDFTSFFLFFSSSVFLFNYSYYFVELLIGLLPILVQGN